MYLSPLNLKYYNQIIKYIYYFCSTEGEKRRNYDAPMGTEYDVRGQVDLDNAGWRIFKIDSWNYYELPNRAEDF